MKIDLLMWTLNSEKTLVLTLESIKKAIPEKYINKKYIIDGGSNDKTILIALGYGWDVITSKKGIGTQANLGLSLVETDVFASFEHDIILCKNWFKKIKNTIKPKNVAVSQGVRISLNKTLNIIEKYSLKRDLRYSSIDNNLYKTKIIKKLGGFSEKYNYSADRALQDKVIKNGYEWLINKNIVSIHNITNLRNRSKQLYKKLKTDTYKENFGLKECLSRFLFSPLRGFDIMLKEKYPQVFFGYPYYRFYILKGVLKK